MAKVKQLNAVNKGKGKALNRLCSALAGANIHINGMMVTNEVIRFLVDDLEKASEVLDGIGVHNAVEEVLAVELDHKPGVVQQVTDKFARRGVKIRYAYSASAPDSGKAILILSVTDMTEAQEALR
jgi:hypothetical protein